MRQLIRFRNSTTRCIASTGLSASILAIILAAPVSAVPADDLVRPGMWEIVSTMDMPNNPQMHPQNRQTHCYTAIDVAGINAKNAALMTSTAAVPADQKCTVKDVQYVGNKGTWNTVCQGGTTVHTDMVFHGDSIEGVLIIRTGNMTMKASMTGKRIGECK